MDKLRIEALKAANPVLDVARDLGLDVTRQRFRCPRPANHAHGDRTPSVSLSPERGSFKCWVCPEVKGDVVDLVRLVKGWGFLEAVRWLEERTPGLIPDAPRQALPNARSRPDPSPVRHPATPPVTSTITSTATSTATSSGVSAHHAHHAHHASPSPPRRAYAGPGPELTLWDTGVTEPPVPPAHGEPARGRTGAPTPPATGAPAQDASAHPAPGLKAMLELASPVRGRAAAWLKSRRIFRRTWEAQGLRVVEDYRAVSEGLRRRFPTGQLQAWGLFNAAGNLRYYRHTLLLPYFDHGEPVYLQARALDPGVMPKELSLPGPITVPYHATLLDGNPGRLYLCEGVIDTLSLLEAGFPAVGIPGAANFKPAWTERFREKSVFVAFDADAAGEAGAARVIALLAEGGVEAHRLQIPPGKDINEWLKGGGLGIRLDAGEEPRRPGRRSP